MSLLERARQLRSNPWSTTLGAYGTSQLVIAVGSFVRIPLLVSAVGADGYGWVIIFSGLAVIVLGIADGISQTTRAVLAEHQGTGAAEYCRIRRLSSLLTGALVGVIAIATLVSLLATDAQNSELVAGLCCLLFAGFAILGAPSRGKLESSGFTALVHTLQTSTTLVGLPILVLALWLSPSIIVAGGVTGLGLALPNICCALAANRRSPDRIAMNLPRRPTLRIPELPAIRNMILWSWSNALNYAFDAAIIGTVLGALYAAEFGLASRVMTLAMMLSLALNPLISASISRWRGRLEPRSLMKKVGTLTIYLAALSSIVSIASVMVGPWLARFLSNGAISTSTPLYMWLGAFAFVSAVTAPLMALFGGTSGIAFRARTSAIMAGTNVLLSGILAYYLGVTGPVLSSTICLCLLATILLVRLNRDPGIVLTRFQGDS